MAKLHNFDLGDSTESEDAPEVAPEPTTEEGGYFGIFVGHRCSHKVINAAELHALVYGAFVGRFEGIDVIQDYSGMHLIVPMENGQVGKVTLSALTDEDLAEWKKKKTI